MISLDEEVINILPLYDLIKDELKNGYRFVHSESVIAFFERFRNIVDTFTEELTEGMKFYRAQLGRNDDEPNCEKMLPHSKKRMIPWKDKAKEGRINPQGIPCFYMASDLDTAIKEISPKYNEYVSVAEVRIDKKMNIVNMIDPKAKYFGQGMRSKDDGRQFIRKYLNKDFAKPITKTDNRADYVLTQVIAELIKREGYDGIKYMSSVGEGENIALFDVGIAERLFSDENISLYQMSDISLTKIL